MKLSIVAFAAVAIAASGLPALAEDYASGTVKTAEIGGKEVLTDSKGMTLYTWDKDEAGVSNCYDKCAAAWPPLLAGADAKPKGEFTLIDRKDGTKIWAHEGMPLYLWINDKKPGDTSGDGVGGTWHTAVD